MHYKPYIVKYSWLEKTNGRKEWFIVLNGLLILQLLLYCLIFTLIVKVAVIDGAVNGLYFYPKKVQERVIENGLIGKIWVGTSSFWKIPGTEDLPYVQIWAQMAKKRGALTVIWLIGSFLIAGIVALL